MDEQEKSEHPYYQSLRAKEAVKKYETGLDRTWDDLQSAIVSHVTNMTLFHLEAQGFEQFSVGTLSVAIVDCAEFVTKKLLEPSSTIAIVDCVVKELIGNFVAILEDESEPGKTSSRYTIKRIKDSDNTDRKGEKE